MEGWLEKMSEGMFPRWQTRYVSHRGGGLSLRPDKGCAKCKLYELSSESGSAKQGETDRELTVACKNGSSARTVKLRAKTKQERDSWLSSLNAPPAHPSAPPEQQQARQQDAPANTATPAFPSPLYESARPPAGPPVVPGAITTSAEAPVVAMATRGGRELRGQAFLSGYYSGEFLGSQRHGMGRFEYSNGNVYTGSWEGDQKGGFGMLRWTNGDMYVGSWKDNKMCGYGQFAYANGNSYAGHFVDDCKEGHGRFVWKEGDVYEGEWKSDVMSGTGTTTYKNGNVYRGGCRNNAKHGLGRMQWAVGDVYEGEWHDGVIEGNGIITYSDGGKYEGEWKADKREGQGKMQQANGDVFTGTWVADVRSGPGSCKHANNDTFVGNFEGNLREGWGVYSSAAVRMLGPDGEVREIAGDQYSGNWHKDQKQGYGKYVWADGDVYDGQWDKDLRSGEGTCTYANGDKYEGQWSEDMRHGWGRLVWTDGNTFEGSWKSDNIAPGTRGAVPPPAAHRALPAIASFRDETPGRSERDSSFSGVPGLQDYDRVGESPVPDILADLGAGLAGAGSWFDQMTNNARPKIRASNRLEPSPPARRTQGSNLLMF